ncbi:MAG: hypothetical protein NTU89_00785 [Candidatus Dependentiae bacterium]|nr:hypothetical protein [Candidatus Dependentiae bacterium]
MNNHIFQINSYSYIELFPTHISVDQISFMNETKVILHQDQTQLLIGMAWSLDIVNDLIEKLTATLTNDLIFHYSNSPSPSILDNEFLVSEELRPFIEEHADNSGRPKSVSMSKYLLCTTRTEVNPDLGVWMYNDMNKNIILEIGENFTWPDLPNENDFIQPTDPIVHQFFQYIDSYQPLIKMTINQETAQTWLKQAQQLKDLIYFNEVAQCSDCMTNKHNETSENPVVHMKDSTK